MFPRSLPSTSLPPPEGDEGEVIVLPRGQNVFLSLELHLNSQREYFCSVCALNSCVSSRTPEKEVNSILRTSTVVSRGLGC